MPVAGEGLLDDSGKKEGRKAKQETGTYEQLVEYLRARKKVGLTIKEAFDSWSMFNGGVSRDTLRRWLDQMAEDGEAFIKDDPAVGKRAAAKRYFPTDTASSLGDKKEH